MHNYVGILLNKKITGFTYLILILRFLHFFLAHYCLTFQQLHYLQLHFQQFPL